MKKTERNREIVAAFRAGDSLGVLEQRYGVSRQRIFQIVSNAGLKRKDRPIRRDLCSRGPRTLMDPADLEAYRNGETTAREIGARMGLMVSTVRTRMHVRGVRKSTRARRKKAYELFKGGKTIPEVAALMGVSKGNAAALVTRGRKEDPNPYYRHEARRPKGNP